MHKVQYTYSRVGCDRKHVLDEEDIETVLRRLPYPLWERLQAVHFNDAWRCRRLGYVTKGRREISICALPPRMSLSAAACPERWNDATPRIFGGPARGQWPPLAVRRFMLYEVFLHEVGHLQLVEPERKSERLRFARERRADEFANRWRKRLWADHFEHPDPVHHTPNDDETQRLQTVWLKSHGEFKRGLILEKSGRYKEATSKYEDALRINDQHAEALARLGGLVCTGLGAERSYETAINYLTRSIDIDRTSLAANYYLAAALAGSGRLEEAESFFERAARLSPNKTRVLARHGKALSESGRFQEADRLFKKAMRTCRRDGWALYYYASSLLDPARPACKENVEKAAALVERAGKLKGEHAQYQERLRQRLAEIRQSEETAQMG